MLRTCNKCFINKPLSEFPKNKTCTNGRERVCKACVYLRMLNRKRTIDGLCDSIYRGQVDRSKARGHTPPPYDKIELRLWLKSLPVFWTLYSAWVKSGYLKNLIPSTDRLDDYKPYSFDNIRLVTWEENNTKGYYDSKIGRNTKRSKTVQMLDLSGLFLKSFHSVGAAATYMGRRSRSSISSACLGKQAQAYGYRWEYKID